MLTRIPAHHPLQCCRAATLPLRRVTENPLQGCLWVTSCFFCSWRLGMRTRTQDGPQDGPPLTIPSHSHGWPVGTLRRNDPDEQSCRCSTGGSTQFQSASRSHRSLQMWHACSSCHARAPGVHYGGVTCVRCALTRQRCCGVRMGCLSCACLVPNLNAPGVRQWQRGRLRWTAARSRTPTRTSEVRMLQTLARVWRLRGTDAC